MKQTTVAQVVLAMICGEKYFKFNEEDSTFDVMIGTYKVESFYFGG